MDFLNSTKLLHHPEHYKEWFETGQTHGPISVKLDLTNICNHSCPGCSDQSVIENNNEILNIELIDEVLTDLRIKLGVKSIQLTGGGEPTSYSDFEKVVKIAKNLDLQIGLITNGSLLHKINLEEVVPALQWIRISLDSYDQASYERTHGKQAQFSRTIQNLKDLLRIRSSLTSKTIIGASFITGLNPLSDKGILEFIALSKSLGVNYAQVKPNMFAPKSDLHNPLMLQLLIDNLKSAEQFSNENFKVVIDYDKYRKVFGEASHQNYNTCHFQAISGLTIGATGDVHMCCNLQTPEGFVGNVKKSSVDEIWHGKIRKSKQRSLCVHKCPSLCVGDRVNESLEAIKSSTPSCSNFI
ncbi:radical SAM/SPASM domain-containing protein [Neptuniibacter sp. QD37_11]|uniref:radical SAM protein n=1 Tax=Neptuniibacter sp. QD37_11 TaxID=3398209 RepID=UPI0039F5081A